MSKTRDIIHLLDRRVLLHQPEGGFRSSIDTVLLAASCPAQSGEKILDLGCSTGAAGLCVLKRVPKVFLTGVDIQKDHIELALENAALNGFSENCDFIHSNVRAFRPKDDLKNIVQFDHVLCNPPYNDADSHTRSPSEAKALAMGHDHTTLQDWIDCAALTLKSGGSFTIIHKADQVDKIIQATGSRFGALEIIPFWPRAGHPAKRVILRCIKGRKSPATLHAGLVLHEENGDYTAEAQAILRDMKALLI